LYDSGEDEDVDGRGVEEPAEYDDGLDAEDACGANAAQSQDK
jgi:hypothetical protein